MESFLQISVNGLILGALCLALVLKSAAQLLPEDEVQVLRTISSQLQTTSSQLRNPYWDLSPSSCSTSSAFNTTISDGDYDIYSRVQCDCSFNSSSVCHVISIQLKGLNLTGNLPVEFRNLTHLQEIDLSRNFLNGSIPRAFGQLQVRILSLLGNNLTGTIPSEIGDITTLEELVLESNMLGGNLPANLGSLGNLKRLLLSSNNFNGTIPTTFGNLKNLTDFRIDGTTITGRIPDFIGNWTKLERLDMQGTAMEGPVPNATSLLKNLKFWRISDLKGSNISFPNLEGLTNMIQLVLRNCSIVDSIPPYIGGFSNMTLLDLSFNMLNGDIPSTLQGLEKLNYLFLSHNSLTDNVPGWILSTREKMDLSYNNFTGPNSASCQNPNLNLVASYSASASSSISWCLKPDLPCNSGSRYHSLFINCGGSETNFEGNEYEDNASTDGPSLYEYHTRWAFSSTGRYVGEDSAPFIVRNDSTMITSDAQIYQTARLAPSSLIFYGLCMRSGSYKVRLHFAEIVFYDNATYNSLGRRVFDVAIQGEVRLPDFDIVKEAGGVRRGIYKEFDINVTSSTLVIHLYWTGKGTMAIPTRGTYGPLISAISVTPNFDVSTGKLSAGAIAGIVISSCAALVLIFIALWIGGCICKKDVEDKELRALELQTGYFTLRQIKAATANFDSTNKIGEGGFGPVYKGVLSDGTIVAVKQLSAKSRQGNREFVNEIGMISALQHPNLVRLFGCCIEGNQLLLIYEYLENNSLARALFGPEDQRLKLDWNRRMKICLGIARGLAYLHEESRLKIVHRDIKASNVLLDKDLNAKISDFGLAKLDEEENTHISTRIAGTVGYMAPEYAMRGYLTDKADVYSFGIVALEIVSGKSNTNYRPKEEFVYLLDWAYVLQEQGNLLELVDPSLGSDYSQKEAMRMLNLALLCANPSPTLRPSMSAAVSMLEGKIPVQAPLVKRGAMGEDIRFKAFSVLSQDSQSHSLSDEYQKQRGGEYQEQRGVSIGGPWIDSTTSLSGKDESQEHGSESRLIPPGL